MRLVMLSVFFVIAGCASVSQEELNAKINKCKEAGMEFTYMKDSAGNPYDVVCVRKHDNEK
jgi:uncharacterized protein YceK